MITGGTAYHVLSIDARNFSVCLWLIASRAEAVSELITKRKRWMIKAHIQMCVCVCHLCEQSRTRAHTQIQIQYRRCEKQRRMLRISEKKRRNWKTEFQYKIHYFCSILICITRLDVKMNILFFSIIYNDHISLTFTEARTLNLNINAEISFPYIIVSVCVCVSHIALECLYWIVYCIVFI